jgi:hypothetical protein
VNVGPNLTYAGSVATLLRRRVARAHNASADLGEFTRLGLLTVPAALILAVPGISMGGCFLHVAQRHAGIKGSGNEGVPERVWTDGLGDAGLAGDPADDPPCAVPVQPDAARGQEDRSLAALSDGQVDRPGGARGSGMVTFLPPLRMIARVRCPRSMPRASMSATVASVGFIVQPGPTDMDGRGAVG